MALDFLNIEAQEDQIDAGSFLCLAVYDVLRELGFKEEALSIVKKFKTEIQACGHIYAHGENPPIVSILQINDNRFAWLMPDSKLVFDFKEISSSERCSLPTLFVGIVLPELFSRVSAGLQAKRDQRGSGASARSSESGPSSGS